MTAKEWPRDVVDDQNFTVIHELAAKRLDGQSGLDSLLVSSREGVTRLYYEDGRWKKELIGRGEPKREDQKDNSTTPGSGDHWGTGGADIGRVGSDRYAYVATIDPFHSTKVCVYTKHDDPTHRGSKWKRHVLDTYGTPTQQKHWGDGPGHYVTCADIDGDGVDEILLSMFGPLDRNDDGSLKAAKGILCYKPIHLEDGVFAKWHPIVESSGRCDVGNFYGNGKRDIVSISYSVKDYYQELHPAMRLYKNLTRDDLQTISVSCQRPTNSIFGTVWETISGKETEKDARTDAGKEIMVYLPDPVNISNRAPAGLIKQDLIEVADIEISVEVHPSGREVKAEANEGIKVLYGSLADAKDQKVKRTPFGTNRFPDKESLKPPRPEQQPSKKEPASPSVYTFTADQCSGAIILRLTPTDTTDTFKTYRKATDVDDKVQTLFDLGNFGLETPKLKFSKVEKLWWGEEFTNVEFYNLTGFHFRFLETKQHVAHMQFWIAGPKVDARLHDHTDQAFRELHTCLSQGTPQEQVSGTAKQGGMVAPRKEYYSKSFEDVKKLEEKLNEGAFDYCALMPLEEHGKIWHTLNDGRTIYRKNGTVSYPAHAWRAGVGNAGENVDVWMALEFDARV
ncbi:hypothetical protein QC763_0098000 [Podospora pseudopauciseta]|uniref:Aldos-2-ulose dehydratase/isomerase (AUDH) Cupin domain-containing protein n=1 Tax=Podospora pseudopauciseta TaxID=2093780 RepID=A0ABR0H6A3_9PEZI|nr:hypothetical protein QC763_0098000 [Podospora pseudopauciseta]